MAKLFCASVRVPNVRPPLYVNMNIREAASHFGVLSRYLSMSTWKPRTERSRKRGKKKRS